MSEKCYKCFRPLKSCYCTSITTIETGLKFVFLMHPKEAYKQKTGTGRLAALSLAESEIIIGIDFTHNNRLNELLNDKSEYRAYFPVVLYPANDAYFTDTPDFKIAMGDKKLLIIVIDATWFFAHKIMQHSKNLHALPKLSFKNAYRSQFIIKEQPNPACLSTIESAFYLIEELKIAGIVNPIVDPSGLLRVFHEMVEFQQICTQRRHEAEAEEMYPDLFQDQGLPEHTTGESL